MTWLLLCLYWFFIANPGFFYFFFLVRARQAHKTITTIVCPDGFFCEFFFGFLARLPPVNGRKLVVARHRT